MSTLAVTASAPLTRRPFFRRLLVLALLAEIGYAVLNLSAMPVYLAFDRKFDAGVVAMVLTAFLLCEAVFKGPMGQLADRYGRRTFILLGPALPMVTAILTIFVPHNWGYTETFLLVLLRCIDGVGAAMIWPALFALVTERVDAHERQHAMSLVNMMYLAGIALAMPIGGAANDLLGPHMSHLGGARSPSLYLASALFLAVLLLGYRWLQADRPERLEATPKRSPLEALRGEWGHLVDSWRRIPNFLILAVVTFMGTGFPFAIVKLFAKEQFGMSESQFGLLVLPAVGALLLLSVAMSRLGQRIGTARAVHLGLGLCAGGMLLIALGAFAPALRSGVVVALGAIPVGVGFLLALPAWYTAVSEIDPQRRAANIGAVMTAQGLGAIFGAPLGGVFYERFQALGADFGRYSPFIGCAICLLAAWLLSLKLLKPPASAHP